MYSMLSQICMDWQYRFLFNPKLVSEEATLALTVLDRIVLSDGSGVDAVVGSDHRCTLVKIFQAEQSLEIKVLRIANNHL